MIKAVIMAGGSGTRLWPLSRSSFPKQFLRINGKYTMLQSTLKRLNRLDISSSVTICNEEHRFFVAEQLREIDKLGSIILEPVRKNTAPAIAMAAIAANDDSLLLILPADHLIQDEDAFCKAINHAIPLAEKGKLVTFGVIPDKAHLGYGYIKKGNEEGIGYCVEKFVEKPSSKAANDFFNSENYLWNSGIFMFKANRYLEELNKFRPDIYAPCLEASKTIEKDLDFIRISKEAFDICPSESIDFAVMEKTKDAVVVPMDAGWSDIGSWSSIWDTSKKDNHGNVTSGDIILKESSNCLISSNNKLVTVTGVNDLVIVDTKDALMVAHKDATQNTKAIVTQLKNDQRNEWELHREVYRPWGKYDLIDKGYRYQVKCITVNPGGKLSVQKHHHRSEHWIVVSGTAKVTKGKETFLLSENQSTYIPVGVIHSLENLEAVELHIIEVQSGDYLGEDDVIRFEDIYGRVKY